MAIWDTGEENVHKNRHKVTKEVEEETNPGKNEHFAKKTERGVFLQLEPTAPCLTGFADAVNNAVRCWKKQRD